MPYTLCLRHPLGCQQPHVQWLILGHGAAGLLLSARVETLATQWHGLIDAVWPHRPRG